MKAGHIAIINVLGPAHVNPTLPVVATLVRRGYRVTYVTSDRFSSEISEIGAEVVYCPRHEFPYNQKHSEGVSIERQYVRDYNELASKTIPTLTAFYQKNIPNLILHNVSAFAGHILAEKLRTPAIRMSPSLPYEDGAIDHPMMPEAYRRTIQEHGHQLDRLLYEHGYQHTGAIFNKEQPTLYFFLEDFQLGPSARYRNRLYAGRCPAERSRGVWKSLCVSDRPMVLVSTSTMYVQGAHYYRQCLAAISELGYHTVLATGPDIDAAEFGALPPHCEIVQGIPQCLIMPHVEMIICMGGTATTMESMYHGLPMLMLTQGGAQHELYAQNVQNHGLGIHLRGPQTNVDSIRASSAELIGNAEIRSNVKRMQYKVKRSPGAEEVCNWIEGYIDK